MTHKTAIVTGGVRGIGKGLALKLAELGYDLALGYTSDSSRPKADAYSAELNRDHGVQVRSYQADVADYAACQRFVDEALDSFGGHIDVLVNNAGFNRLSPFVDVPPERFARVIQVNLVGYMNMVHVTLPHFLKQGYGQIVNIGSISAQVPLAGMIDYSASKGGVQAFTRALAAELADKRIMVNEIAPGDIFTELTELALREHPEIVAATQAAIPLKRSGTPADVAWALEYLLKAEYVTGETVSVNGGWHMA